jgi:hypothetical protein
VISVCDNHVVQGLRMLNIPHIKKTSLGLACTFCGKRASFEISYFINSELYKLKPKQKSGYGKKVISASAE